VDVALERAQSLATLAPEATAGTDWQSVLQRDDVHIVIVSTTNNSLAEITEQAVRAGKHVLVEKPAARSAKELESVLSACTESKSLVRVGFNHRYHPAFTKTHELLEARALGDLMFVRGRYGHGGRIGYDKEWRANPELSGGGELIDQGVHLIDLSRWILGDFTRVHGIARTFYWEMPVDDNAFALMETADDKVAFLHCSCTEWKNLFSLEIYGRSGKLHIEGLGGSYGTERLAYYKMLPAMGPPETTIWEYPMGDSSWMLEFEEFLEDIRLDRTPSPGVTDAYAALRVVEQIYSESKVARSRGPT
jgi:predicted dehydrogenase